MVKKAELRSPVGKIGRYMITGCVIDPGKPDPLELHHCIGLPDNARLAYTLQVSLRFPERTRQCTVNRQPLNNWSLACPRVSQGVPGIGEDGNFSFPGYPDIEKVL
jgi:hypothetical protein